MIRARLLDGLLDRDDCPYGCGTPLSPDLRWSGTPCVGCGHPLHVRADDPRATTARPAGAYPDPDMTASGEQVWHVMTETESAVCDAINAQSVADDRARYHDLVVGAALLLVGAVVLLVVAVVLLVVATPQLALVAGVLALACLAGAAFNWWRANRSPMGMAHRAIDHHAPRPPGGSGPDEPPAGSGPDEGART
ncbi:MAG TPA: hypothetical protein VFY23_06795 [Candidatus Limnocylindrales bacterium]|nr:hypothetical protein [Candidatus Limnocylindrales bacterium]